MAVKRLKKFTLTWRHIGYDDGLNYIEPLKITLLARNKESAVELSKSIFAAPQHWHLILCQYEGSLNL